MRDMSGNTALHHARDNHQMCELLLGNGAHWNIKNDRDIAAHSEISNEESSNLIWPLAYPQSASINDVVAIDMTMISLQWADGHTAEVPVEIAIVDANQRTLYSSKCRPPQVPIAGSMSHKLFVSRFQNPKIDLRGWMTGLRPGSLDNAPALSDVVRDIQQIIQGKYLVGRSLKNQIKVLSHPVQARRDIEDLLAWKRKTVGTGAAAIQEYMRRGGRTKVAVHGAKQAMEIYLMYQAEWESNDGPFHIALQPTYEPKSQSPAEPELSHFDKPNKPIEAPVNRYDETDPIKIVKRLAKERGTFPVYEERHRCSGTFIDISATVSTSDFKKHSLVKIDQ